MSYQGKTLSNKNMNIYFFYSGAGDGLPSQTTADFGPTSNSHIVKMENGQRSPPSEGIGESLPNSSMEDPSISENIEG